MFTLGYPGETEIQFSMGIFFASNLAKLDCLSAHPWSSGKFLLQAVDSSIRDVTLERLVDDGMSVTADSEPFRQKIGFIPQRPCSLRVIIAENLRYGEEDNFLYKRQNKRPEISYWLIYRQPWRIAL